MSRIKAQRQYAVFLVKQFSDMNCNTPICQKLRCLEARQSVDSAHTVNICHGVNYDHCHADYKLAEGGSAQ